MNRDPFLSVRDVEKSFPEGNGRQFVLRRISLDVAKGDFVTIMGPSGAGKSTLLAVLGMLDGDWTGEYRLLEHDVHKLKHKDRIALGKQYVGFVFQQYHLIDDLTVAENLAMPLSPTRSTVSAWWPRRISIPASSPAVSSSSWRSRAR